MGLQLLGKMIYIADKGCIPLIRWEEAISGPCKYCGTANDYAIYQAGNDYFAIKENRDRKK